MTKAYSIEAISLEKFYVAPINLQKPQIKVFHFEQYAIYGMHYELKICNIHIAILQ